jgi:hypothetical protein
MQQYVQILWGRKEVGRLESQSIGCVASDILS